MNRDLLRLYLLLGLPLIVVLLVMSLFNETLPHWSGPAYISILLVAAAYLCAASWSQVAVRRVLTGSVALLVFVSLAGILVVRYYPSQLGSTDPGRLGKGDVTLDMNGWEQFALKFDSLADSDKKHGLMQPGAFILSDYWYPAANLDYYVASPRHISFLAVGRLRDIHHYAWLNLQRPALAPGADAYFIYPSNYYGPPRESLRDNFQHVDSVEIPQQRMGVHVRNFVIYRMHGYMGGIAPDGVQPESRE